MEIWCAGLLYYRVVETESFWRYPYAEESVWTFCLTSSEHHIVKSKHWTVTESTLLDYKWRRSFWPCITVLRNVGSFLWVGYMIWRWMCMKSFQIEKKIHKLWCIFTAHRDILMLSIESSFGWDWKSCISMSCDQVQLSSMFSIQTSINLSIGMIQVWAPNMNHCLAIPLQGD